ncbi:uncharacterized protein METZ01_LOCUS354769, partial [marine metagenome]
LKNSIFPILLLILSPILIYSQQVKISIEGVGLNGFSDIAWTSKSEKIHYLYFWDANSRKSHSFKYITPLYPNSVKQLADLPKDISDELSNGLTPNKRYWFTANINNGLDVAFRDSASTLSSEPSDITITPSFSTASITIIDKINPSYTEYLISLLSSDNKRRYVGPKGLLISKKYWFPLKEIGYRSNANPDL